MRITARSSSNVSELQIAFDSLDVHDAPIDVVMEKSPAKLEVLAASFEISGFCNLVGVALGHIVLSEQGIDVSFLISGDLSSLIET